jgi:hypothetical protein
VSRSGEAGEGTATAGPRERPGMTLARLFERRGLRVVDAAGVLWGEYRRVFHVSLPFVLRADLDVAELQDAMRARRLAAVRYPTLTAPGLPSGMFVCETAGYGMNRVVASHRRQVKKGLSRCEIRDIDPDELLARGMELNLDTMRRHGRVDPEFADPRRWKRLVTAVRDVPGMTAPAAFVDGRLSAYTLVCRDGPWLYLLFRMSRTADLIHRTNPALDFHILSAAASDPTLQGVQNSPVSVTRGAETLHRYKQAMGYEIVPHPLAIHFHPALAPALTNLLAVGAARALAGLRPSSRRFELAAKVLLGARLSRTGSTTTGVQHAVSRP